MWPVSGGNWAVSKEGGIELSRQSTRVRSSGLQSPQGGLRSPEQLSPLRFGPLCLHGSG